MARFRIVGLQVGENGKIDKPPMLSQSPEGPGEWEANDDIRVSLNGRFLVGAEDRIRVLTPGIETFVQDTKLCKERRGPGISCHPLPEFEAENGDVLRVQVWNRTGGIGFIDAIGIQDLESEVIDPLIERRVVTNSPTKFLDRSFEIEVERMRDELSALIDEIVP